MSEPDIIDIIDFQSEDRSAHQKSETRPVPKSIKLLIGGIALVLVIAAVVLYGMSNKTTSSVNMDGDEEVMAVGGGADSDQALGTDELIASLDVARVAPTRAQKMDEQISTMASQIQTMAQQIKALTAQNKTLGQLNTQVSKNTQDLKTTLTQDDLTEIKLELDNTLHKTMLQNNLLQKSSKDIKIASAKPDKKTYKKRTTYRPRLPFKLITIDQWGGDNYAAVESNETTGIENLRRGDRLSGWKIEQIDAVESSVVFKNVTTGRSVKKTFR